MVWFHAGRAKISAGRGWTTSKRNSAPDLSRSWGRHPLKIVPKPRHLYSGTPRAKPSPTARLKSGAIPPIVLDTSWARRDFRPTGVEIFEDEDDSLQSPLPRYPTFQTKISLRVLEADSSHQIA